MKFYERVISDYGGYEKCKGILSKPQHALLRRVCAKSPNLAGFFNYPEPHTSSCLQPDSSSLCHK